MSRFDGGRQGIGVWIFGLAITLILAAIGANPLAPINRLAAAASVLELLALEGRPL